MLTEYVEIDGSDRLDLPSPHRISDLALLKDRETVVARAGNDLILKRPRTLPVFLTKKCCYNAGRSSFALLSDEQRVIVRLNFDKITMYDLTTGAEVRTFESKHATVIKTEENLIAASDEDLIHLLDIRTRKTIQRLSGHEWFVQSLLLQSNKHRVTSVSSGEEIKVWDLRATAVPRTVDYQSEYVEGTSDSDIIVTYNTGYRNPKIMIHDMQTDIVYQFPLQECRSDEHETIRYVSKLDWILDVALSPDNSSLIATGSSMIHRNFIQVWDLKTRALIAKFGGTSNEYNSIATDDDASRILIGSKGGFIAILNRKN